MSFSRLQTLEQMDRVSVIVKRSQSGSDLMIHFQSQMKWQKHVLSIVVRP